MKCLICGNEFELSDNKGQYCPFCHEAYYGICTESKLELPFVKVHARISGTGNPIKIVI